MVKITRAGATWGGPKHNWYWFSWYNTLPKRSRYVGLRRDWYDGPIASFGFWFFNMAWSTPWTKPPKEYRRPRP